MNTLTIEQMKSLVEACTYKPGWEIIFDNDGERPFVQIAATTLCSASGEASAWKSGKTYLSPYMCRQEPSVDSTDIEVTNASPSLVERLGFGKTQTADQIVDGAIAAFTTAVENLDKAYQKIETGIKADVVKVEALQQSIEKATVASSRIQRIKERVAEFIS